MRHLATCNNVIAAGGGHCFGLARGRGRRDRRMPLILVRPVSGVSTHPFSLGKPYHFYRPGLTKYGPEQWLWDSASHMTVWSHRNVSNALLDMRTMLSMQRADGRVPEQIYWVDGDTSSKLQYSERCCADLTQMPVLLRAARYPKCQRRCKCACTCA